MLRKIIYERAGFPSAPAVFLVHFVNATNAKLFNDVFTVHALEIPIGAVRKE